MKKVKILIVFLIFIFLSCKTKIKKYYFDSGELLSEVEVNRKGLNDGIIKEYYKSGQLKGISYYRDGTKIDTAKLFYINGNIKLIETYSNGEPMSTRKFYDTGELEVKMLRNNDGINQINFSKTGEIIAKGNVKDGVKHGFWEYNDLSYGNKKIIEYLDIDKKEFINQIKYYDYKGEIVRDSSKYFILKFPDTLKANKMYIGDITLIPYGYKEPNSYLVHFFIENLKGNIIVRDTTFGTNNKNAVLWYKPSATGHQKLRGYILEKLIEVNTNNKDTTKFDVLSIEKKMYFEKMIHVE
jgi:antitoxin component YwqK of YwqJK toxin-antitoxin module